MNRIVHGDNLEVLRELDSASIPLIYIDPPFNTGRHQSRPQMKTIRDDAGDRTGFGGQMRIARGSFLSSRIYFF